MTIKILKSFSTKLEKQIAYISKDKPQAARNFKKEILERIKELDSMPYKHQKSKYFDSEAIRDLVFKGYVVVYRINENQKAIEVFGFIKYEEKL